MTDKADNDALVQRVEYILDMTASAKERMHRRWRIRRSRYCGEGRPPPYPGARAGHE